VAIGYRSTPTPTEMDEALNRQLDELIVTAARSGVPWLNAELGRLLRRRGKRIRPALLFAAARCGPGTDLPAALSCAAAVELLHRSTLVHDDLMDNARYRGDEVTMHRTSGLAGALLGGDYLFGAGGRLIAGVSLQATRIWHDAYVDLCDGQARETANRHRAVSPDEYLLCVHGKTAALVRAACQLGALCGGLKNTEAAALARYGECFGTLFQLVDDLMDVASTPALYGKPVRHDAGQGVFTLPVLEGARRAGLNLGPDLSPATEDAVYEAARRYGIAPAVEMAYEWADRARAAVEELPPSASRYGLERLPEDYLTATLTARVAPAYQPLVQPLLR
jgi:geranylgeranyl pyrophosphate synthase